MLYFFSNDREIIEGHVEFSNNHERSSQVESKFISRIVYMSQWKDLEDLPYCTKSMW